MKIIHLDIQRNRENQIASPYHSDHQNEYPQLYLKRGRLEGQ
jgi:hypothetical protein